MNNHDNDNKIDDAEHDESTLIRFEKKQPSAAKRAEVKKRMDDYVYEKEIRDILNS